MAALLNGSPVVASSTAAGAVGCASKRRRPNSMPGCPGYPAAGGSPGVPASLADATLDSPSSEAPLPGDAVVTAGGRPREPAVLPGTPPVQRCVQRHDQQTKQIQARPLVRVGQNDLR